MAIQKIKVEESEVEILNSIDDVNSKKPKITKIKADDSSSSGNPFEQMFENMNGNDGGGIPENMQNNPMFKMMGNIGEIKKIKFYFFISLLCGFIALFAWREYLGVIAIVFGGLDLWKGSKLTKTASYIGIFFGLIALVLYFR